MTGSTQPSPSKHASRMECFMKISKAAMNPFMSQFENPNPSRLAVLWADFGLATKQNGLLGFGGWLYLCWRIYVLSRLCVGWVAIWVRLRGSWSGAWRDLAAGRLVPCYKSSPSRCSSHTVIPSAFCFCDFRRLLLLSTLLQQRTASPPSNPSPSFFVPLADGARSSSLCRRSRAFVSTLLTNIDESGKKSNIFSD
ncbi:hypothetical protein KSP40_PGU018473 [Platanthera guangdongensis]|uniref:Uncharacterized protein n=1 Tax=Platanthera guangdongensis TaxID=2320717 RepID=A0ABR2N1Q0_9ASPA